MRWDVDPVLIDLGPLAIRWYGALFASGVLAMALVLPRLFRKRGHPEEHATAVSLWLLIGLVLGAHLLHLAFYEPQSFVDDPFRIVEFGLGLSSHGGAVGAIVALWLFCRRRGVAFHPYADAMALTAVWVVPFVRLGNFFNSEIIGTATDLPWGIVFVRAGYGQPHHPAQLYEAIVGILLVGLAFWLDRRRDRFRPGFAFYLVLLLYFSARFAIEFVKEYQVLSPSFPLTMGHLLSIPAIVAAGIGLRWASAATR